MTHRLYAFPRLDVREAPRRESTPGTWRADWAQAIARAASIKAVPSLHPLPQRVTVSRFAGVEAVVRERRRKEEALEP